MYKIVKYCYDYNGNKEPYTEDYDMNFKSIADAEKEAYILALEEAQDLNEPDKFNKKPELFFAAYDDICGGYDYKVTAWDGDDFMLVTGYKVKIADEIFLLSIEEYEKYKKVIPKFNDSIWLRTQGKSQDRATYVHSDGSICRDGFDVSDDCFSVRPVLQFDSYGFTVGQRTVMYDFPWILIDKDLWIAEVPVATHRFHKKSNDYEKSEIRQFLLNWIKERK